MLLFLSLLFIAAGADGQDLLVSNPGHNNVLRYSPNGTFVDSFVSGGSAPGADRLVAPLGIGYGIDHNLYVLSNGNGVGANGLTGVLRYDGASGQFKDVFAQPTNFTQLRGLAFGPAGDLYVTGLANSAGQSVGSLVRLNPATGAVKGQMSLGAVQPQGLTIGPDSMAYVAIPAEHAVARYNPTTGATAGTISVGAHLQPEGVTFGPDGNLYVTARGQDGVAGGVREFNPSTGELLDSFATTLVDPLGIRFGPDGNLYVAVSNTDKVLTYSGTTHEFLSVFAGPGTPGTADALSGPSYLAFIPAAWHNPVNGLDVNADGAIEPLDALLIINRLNANGPRPLPPPTSSLAPPPYVDTVGDGQLVPLDALLVINALNAASSAGATTVGMATLSVVPEPGSACLALAAGFCLACRQLLRRCRARAGRSITS